MTTKKPHLNVDKMKSYKVVSENYLKNVISIRIKDLNNQDDLYEQHQRV